MKFYWEKSFEGFCCKYNYKIFYYPFEIFKGFGWIQIRSLTNTGEVRRTFATYSQKSQTKPPKYPQNCLLPGLLPAFWMSLTITHYIQTILNVAKAYITLLRNKRLLISSAVTTNYIFFSWRNGYRLCYFVRRFEQFGWLTPENTHLEYLLWVDKYD